MKSTIIIFLLSLILFSFLNAQLHVRLDVDMKRAVHHGVFVPEKDDTLLLRGNFTMWQGNHFILADPDADSIYSLTFDPPAPAGAELEYKYVIHKKDGKDIWEHYPQKNNPPFGNRRIPLPAELPVVQADTFDLNRYWTHVNVQFGPGELQENYTGFMQTIDGLHPALCDYTGKEKFDSLFAETAKILSDIMSAPEFLRLLSPLVTRIGCGHSGVHMPDEWWATQPNRFFRLKLWIQNARAFIVLQTATQKNLPKGTEIISINGKSLRTIVEYLLTVISYDGDRKSYKYAQLNDRFPLYYAMYYGFPDHFSIEYRNKQSEKIKSVNVTAESRENVMEDYSRKPELSFHIGEDIQSGILKISNFNYYRNLEFFTSFIDSVFFVIKDRDIEHLLLDLQDNDGSDPFASAYLFSNLIAEPLPYFAGEYGHYAPLALPVVPKINAFEGDLYILTNGKCFSTTGHLCALFKYHTIGKNIGEETGEPIFVMMPKQEFR